MCCSTLCPADGCTVKALQEPFLTDRSLRQVHRTFIAPIFWKSSGEDRALNSGPNENMPSICVVIERVLGSSIAIPVV